MLVLFVFTVFSVAERMFVCFVYTELLLIFRQGCGRWYAPSPRHLRSVISIVGGSSCWSFVVVFLSCVCVCDLFDDDTLTPTGYPPHTQQPTRPTARSSYSTLQAEQTFVRFLPTVFSEADPDLGFVCVICFSSYSTLQAELIFVRFLLQSSPRRTEHMFVSFVSTVLCKLVIYI